MKIIRISAMWCPGCLLMKKIWKNIELDYNNINFIDLDYDMDNEEVIKYNPGKILPVVIFLNNENIEQRRLIGEQKEKILREVIDNYVKKY